MQPSVSVIIPVYKVETYLNDCLHSVVEQNYDNLEIILIDDASPDASGAICDRWASTDPRIRVIHQPINGGSSVARNAGIEIATGDRFTFVDSDDLVAPTLISTMVSQSLENEADIVVSGLTEFSTGSPEFRMSGPPRIGSAEEILHEIVCVRPRWSPWGKLYDRSLFAAGLRFPEGLLHQDLHMTPRAFSLGSRAVLSDDALYGYRQRPGSVMDQRRTHSVSVDLITVLTSNIEFARRQADTRTDFEQYLAAYILQASQQVEQFSRGDEWVRNRAFREAYIRMARTYLREMMECQHLSKAYRAMFALSAVSPLAFREAFNLARLAKGTVAPRLSRHIAQ